MNDLTARVEHVEREVGDIKVTLARMEGRFDAIDAKFEALDQRFDGMVTWKAAFAGLAVLSIGLLGVIGTVIGAAWWMAQQYLAPLLQAAGAG